MIDRRKFMIGTAAAAGSLVLRKNAKAAATGYFVAESSIEALQAAMRKGTATSVSITRGYLDRIASLDPKLNSIIEKNRDALAIAARMDAERVKGRVRGPLHGIPVVIKDNIDTADTMKTTAGSLALNDAPTPSMDAFIVSRLRDAGAILIGKTNLSEWANFRDNDSISGWSGRGGQTHNPYILDRNPCGSSSGTGAAISANLAAIGIGTETDGSIVCPSSICGIVGIKPTVGLVSRSGIIPISASQDTAGPMCRSVSDAAALLSIIAAADPNDVVAGSEGKAGTDYSKYLQADGLRGARIGIARDHWGRRADVDTVMDAAIETCKKAGAVLVDVKFPNLRKFGDAEFIVLQYEFKDGLQRYLQRRGSRHKTLEDLIKFNRENITELKYFGQSILESSAKLGDLNSKEYKEALETCRRYARTEGIDQVMAADRLDAIMAPSNAPTWMIDTVNGDCGSGYVGSSSLAAVAGYPNITVPAGMTRELPIGVSFFGRAWSEATLIKIAFSFEQATKSRRQPKFLPTYT